MKPLPPLQKLPLTLLVCLVAFCEVRSQCAFNLGADKYYCQGQTINTTINGPAAYTSYLWSTGSTTQNITATAAGTYICTATLQSANLINNGNFSAGNTGFTSSYTVGTGGSWGPLSLEGTYLVSNNPNAAHSNFPYFGDHTSGNGNMMVVNGAGTANTSVWCQTITVTPNTVYNFSTWVATCVASNTTEIANLQFSINGGLLGAVFSPPLTSGQWSQFSASWNSGANTSATICIENQSTVISGNDFAMDDIFFQQVCTYSDTLKINVVPLPNISVTSPLTIDCTVSSVTMNASSTTAGVAYSWAGPSAFSSTLQNPVTSVAGTYTVTVTEPLNNCTSTATVVVNSNPQLNVAVGGPQLITCANPSATISGSSTSTGVIYAWTGPAAFTSSIQNPSVTQAGTYTLTVSDATGNCTATATVVVSIDTIKPNVSAGPDQTLSCGATTITLTGTSSTTGVTYLWTGPASQTSSTSSITTNIPGTYTLSVINPSNGCSAQDTTLVNPSTAGPTANTTAVDVSCNGGNNGSATVTLTGGTAPFTYSWSNNATLNSANATGLSAAAYTCTITDNNGCIVTSTVTVLQPAPIVLSAIPTATVCPGQQVNLTTTASGGVGPYTYNWFDANSNPIANPYSPASSGQYMAIATDANGCSSAPLIFIINVYTAPAIVTNTPAAICQGGCVNATATASGGMGNYTYQWMPGNLTTTTVQLCPTQTTTYTVTLTDGCGQPQAPVTVTVHPLPNSPILASDTAGCEPLCVNFAGNAMAGYTYYWSTSNNANASGATFYHCFGAGTYTIGLTVTDNFGCTDSVKTVVNAYIVPNAQFHYQTAELDILDPQVNFINTSSGATSYSWNFGDGQESSSTAIHPSFLFPDKEACYTVSLIASNTHCTDTTIELICIKDVFTIYFPNAFTPDNDGLNDVWMPLGTGIDEKNFYFAIYDRWGNMVFDTDVLNKGWNGIVKDHSETVQEDVYIWKTKLKDRYGLSHEYKGRVSVVR